MLCDINAKMPEGKTNPVQQMGLRVQLKAAKQLKYKETSRYKRSSRRILE